MAIAGLALRESPMSASEAAGPGGRILPTRAAHSGHLCKPALVTRLEGRPVQDSPPHTDLNCCPMRAL